MGRKEMGLTFIKFDVRLKQGVPGTTIGSPTKFEYGMGRRWRAPGSGPGTTVTDAGIDSLVAIVAAVREKQWGGMFRYVLIILVMAHLRRKKLSGLGAHWNLMV